MEGLLRARAIGLGFSMVVVGSAGCSSQGTNEFASAGVGGTSGASQVAASTGTLEFDGGTGGNACPSCKPTETCVMGACQNSCALAKTTRSSVGCDYYAIDMDSYAEVDKVDVCFASFVANASGANAHISVTFDGAPIDLGKYALVPKGAGKKLTYAPYDPVVGLPSGEVALLFLADSDKQPMMGLNLTHCPVPTTDPVPAAIKDTVATFSGTGIGKAFHISTDVPVVAYQMSPYGGGSAAVTGATLLIPTSAWDTNYVALNPEGTVNVLIDFPPTMSIVAQADATHVTILPKVSIVGGTGVPGSAANVPVTYALDAGQVLQITQGEDLSGSPVQADHPIAFFGGHTCLALPQNEFFCDHAEQQIPPVRALGDRYAAVSYRARNSEPDPRRYRLLGLVASTTLTYDPPIAGAPSSVDSGQVVDFYTEQPFVVRSQDKDHPFAITTYMSGSSAVGKKNGDYGYGDPDWVRLVASEQYLTEYVFFTDPTYPETDLVVVRKREGGAFHDVDLDCAGTLAGWAPVDAAGEFEFTRIDLVRHDYEPQGNCDNGRHEMKSAAPFGLWVWGWGTSEPPMSYPVNPNLPELTPVNVSYGYPAGESIAPINMVEVPPVPK